MGLSFRWRCRLQLCGVLGQVLQCCQCASGQLNLVDLLHRCRERANSYGEMPMAMATYQYLTYFTTTSTINQCTHLLEWRSKATVSSAIRIHPRVPVYSIVACNI